MNETPSQIYKSTFPGYTPNFHQEALLEQIDDLPRWKETLALWAANNYSPRNLFGMLSRYEEAKPKPRMNVNVGRFEETDEPVAVVDVPSCEWCGEQWCLRTHDAERRQAA